MLTYLWNNNTTTTTTTGTNYSIGNDNNRLTQHKIFSTHLSRINCAVPGHIVSALAWDPVNVFFLFLWTDSTDESTWWRSGWARYWGLCKNGGGEKRRGEIKTAASNEQSACVWNMEIAVGDSRQQGSRPSAGLPDYCSISQRATCQSSWQWQGTVTELTD